MLKGTPYPRRPLPTGVRVHFHWAGDATDPERVSPDPLLAFASETRVRLLLVQRDGSQLGAFDSVAEPPPSWAVFVRELLSDLARLVASSQRRERPLSLCYGDRGIHPGNGNTGLRIDSRLAAGFGEIRILPPGLPADPGASPLAQRWPALFDRSFAASRPDCRAARQRALDEALASAADEAAADLPPGARFRIDLRRANLDGLELRNAQPAGCPLAVPDLRGALMARCNLSAADLAGADLRGADLSGTDLSATSIDGALTHGATIRPEDAVRVSRRTLTDPGASSDAGA